MKSLRRFSLLAVAVLILASAFSSASAQERKVMNRPYIDTRVWHYGFLFGLHMQDISIANSGYTYDNGIEGEQWYAEVQNWSPGFSVGVLGELRLNEYLSLRVIPTMHFGDKKVVFHEQKTDAVSEQSIKSTYLSVPFDLKLSAPRFNNYRPYVMAGVAPSLDLTVKKQKQMLVKRADCMFEVGMGIDLYYPWFKLIPELKFCFGLTDMLVKDRADLTDISMLKYSDSLAGGQNRMIVLTLYFE